MKTYGRVPKTLLRYCEQPSRAIFIDEIGGEGEDGLWIYLKRGFWNPSLETHCYHEPTVAKLIEAFNEGPAVCDCIDCLRYRLIEKETN